MDLKQELQKLPEPDPASLDRVWSRFQETRAQPERRVPWALFAGGGLLLAAAAAVALLVRPGGTHTVVLEGAHVTHDWSEQIDLEFDGQGEIAGTARDAEIHWRSGTLNAHVVPNSHTKLAVITEEARVEVVGTVFSVTRDRLGVTTAVSKGKVSVTCTDGWEGFVTPESGAHTCLPTRPIQLLGRADALQDRGATPQELLQTLDLGLSLAERDSAVHSELLVRRMHTFGDLKDTAGVLRDAEAYLAGPGSRRTDVQRYAGYLALQEGDCSVALPYLSALELTGTAEDRVLLAECLVESQPARASGLLSDALPHLDATWKARAEQSLQGLGR